jgi:uncharacterized protein (TIGR02246 family)
MDSDGDLEAIRQVVATVVHAQRNELPEEFIGLFRADAIWTTGGGKRLFGRAAIGDFTREVLPGGMAGLKIDMEVAHVLFIRPDVAAVKVRQIYTDAEGVESEGTPLFVMAKEEGRWLLTACQNTGVE